MLLLQSATRRKLSSGDTHMEYGSLNDAAVPTPLAFPEEPEPANIVTAEVETMIL